MLYPLTVVKYLHLPEGILLFSHDLFHLPHQWESSDGDKEMFTLVYKTQQIESKPKEVHNE